MTNAKTIKDKLKCIYNCKTLWIIAFCLVQIAFVLANIYYYSRTNYCSDIYITSPTDCEVSFVTPIGTKYIQNVKANVTFMEHKRPLAEIHAPECATVQFSSDKVSISDIFIFTMKVKGLHILWMIATVLCSIPLLLNLNCLPLIIIQIPFIVIFVFLYFNISYYSGFIIFSPKECTVHITTPLEAATDIQIPTNEYTYIEKNAIMTIEYPEYAAIRFDSDTVSVIDVFDYYCRRGFFFYWFAFTFMLFLPFLIRSWQPKQDKI